MEADFNDLPDILEPFDFWRFLFSSESNKLDLELSTPGKCNRLEIILDLLFGDIANHLVFPIKNSILIECTSCAISKYKKDICDSHLGSIIGLVLGTDINRKFRITKHPHKSCKIEIYLTKEKYFSSKEVNLY